MELFEDAARRELALYPQRDLSLSDYMANWWATIPFYQYLEHLVRMEGRHIEFSYYTRYRWSWELSVTCA